MYSSLKPTVFFRNLVQFLLMNVFFFNNVWYAVAMDDLFKFIFKFIQFLIVECNRPVLFDEIIYRKIRNDSCQNGINLREFEM